MEPLGPFVAVGDRDMLSHIRSSTPPNVDTGEDQHMWKHGEDVYKDDFSAKKTWEQIRSTRNIVDWHTTLWFPQAIPRASFITWIAIRNRLPTGDRISMWGESHSCFLCREPLETRDHLFFACPFSYTVWTILCSKVLCSRISPDWTTTLHSLSRNRLSRSDAILVKLAFQVTVYATWRERNGRKHQKPIHSPLNIAYRIDADIRYRLKSLTSATNNSPDLVSRWNSMTSLPTEGSSFSATYNIVAVASMGYLKRTMDMIYLDDGENKIQRN
ncbi:LOW QUALITY PROTEIN: hypothetical protein Bca101_010673 [Brassica carinata]